MYKKIVLLFGFTLLALVITACGSTSSTQNLVGSSNEGLTPSNTTLPLELQLAVGTFRLEDTDLAVQAEQAAALLPLWQAYSSLSTSDTVAKIELEGLLSQIQETMTAEQNQAITDMKLAFQDMVTVSQSLGLSAGFGNRPGMQGTPGASTNRNQMPGGAAGGGSPGGVPGDVPPGMDPRQGQSDDPAVQATRQAFRESRQSAGINPMLLEALIKLLEEKITPAE